MTTIIDTSVALKWVLPEKFSDEAYDLRNARLAASEILLVESANALWRHVVVGRVLPDDAAKALQRIADAGVEFFPIGPDIQSALALGLRLRHPIYDCLYLAAAIRERAHLITADTRFAAAVRRHGDLKGYIRVLGES